MDTVQFRPTRRVSLPRGGAVNRNGCLQPFPWTKDSARKIWNGRWRADARWSQMVDEYADATMVAQGGKLFILRDSPKKPVICLDLSDPPPADGDTPRAAWAFRSVYPFDPLVLLAQNHCVFVLELTKNWNVAGYICQHGGRITSIAVHPSAPNIFATTSADFTTRIYNLDRRTVSNVENPEWFPWKGPSHASAAHGSDGLDTKVPSDTLGRCIQILVGGRSGGHAWEVSCAAFHARLPLIATCGVDRFVKIWRTHIGSDERVIRDDKPLFSARITTSQVLSVAWLAEDVLILHTGTTFTPTHPEADSSSFPGGEEEDQRMSYHRISHGTIDIIKWFGLDRYFPAGGSDPDPVLRGGASDYQESKSYTVLATESLIPPQEDRGDDCGERQPSLQAISTISQQPVEGLHGIFLFVFPYSSDFILVDAAKLKRRTLPKDMETSHDLVELTKRMRVDDSPLPGRTSILDSTKENIVACAVRSSDDFVILGSGGTVWYLVSE